MARPMQRSDMRTEVYARLGENAGFYVNSEINQWLADGVDDICTKLEPIIDTRLYNVTTNIGEYDIGDDVLNVRKVWFKDSNSNWQTLEEIPYEDLFDLAPDWDSTDNAADPPSRWYLRSGKEGDVVGFYPIPSKTRGDALRIIFSLRPPEMGADTDLTGLPSWLDRVVVLYAVMRCFLKDKDPIDGGIAQREYDRMINLAARKLNKHRKSQAPAFYPLQNNYRRLYRTAPTRRVIRVTS